ncbi:MAG: hypothetical protein ACXW4K_11645 [Candidatus Deferrimicrobiaceae bacterium]
MRRFLAILFLAPLWVASAGYAGTLSWDLPTALADGTPITTAESRKIIVEVYAGPTENGPWKWIAASLPGATSVAVMDPPPWKTLWYTAKSNLSGSESVYAVPVKKTNYSIPSLKRIAKAMLARKKWILPAFLVFLLLLAGAVWALRVRGKKRNRNRII